LGASAFATPVGTAYHEESTFTAMATGAVGLAGSTAQPSTCTPPTAPTTVLTAPTTDGPATADALWQPTFVAPPLGFETHTHTVCVPGPTANEPE
jgi:hypothetical protein